MAKPRYSEVSVRDGELTGTVAIGAVAAIGLAEGLAVTLAWPFFVLVAGLLPATLSLAWLYAGPSRLELDLDDRLRYVGRARRSQIFLGDLTSVEHPGGRRKTALTFWDEPRGAAIDLRDHTFRTEPFRRLLGERLRALEATGIEIDKRAAELLCISEG